MCVINTKFFFIFYYHHHVSTIGVHVSTIGAIMIVLFNNESLMSVKFCDKKIEITSSDQFCQYCTVKEMFTQKCVTWMNNMQGHFLEAIAECNLCFMNF